MDRCLKQIVSWGKILRFIADIDVLPSFSVSRVLCQHTVAASDEFIQFIPHHASVGRVNSIYYINSAGRAKKCG